LQQLFKRIKEMETVIVRVRSERDRRKLIDYSMNNGWQAQSFNEMLNEFIETAPQDVPITDDVHTVMNNE